MIEPLRFYKFILSGFFFFILQSFCRNSDDCNVFSCLGKKDQQLLNVLFFPQANIAY